jgi:Flp pilus assembly pilin Flp
MNRKKTYRIESRGGLGGQDGQSLIEYMILLALVVLVCVGTTKALGSKVHSKFREIRDQIEDGIPVRLNP